jgi:alpha/beta superfamily hydrolase
MTKTFKVWIECEEARLYSKMYLPDVLPAPALLICHGMDRQGFHFLNFYTQLAETACNNGFVSLVFDFRGVGNSTGKFDYGSGEQLDVRCALNYLTSRHEVTPNEVFVVGHSLGGAVSLYALRNDRRIRGLVLWSVPKNHEYNVRKFITRTRGKLGLYLFLFFSRIDRFFNVSNIFKLQVHGINLRLKDVTEKLMKINECEAVSRLTNLPLLIVVGDEDVIVGEDEARQVFSCAQEPKSLLVIKGADHNYKGKENELISKTIDWIENLRTGS